eukprot:c29986_g1_i1 orf=121-1611(+)
MACCSYGLCLLLSVVCGRMEWGRRMDRKLCNAHARAARLLPSSSARANKIWSKRRASRMCISFASYARDVIDHLRSCQIPVCKGLSEEELLQIERRFGFWFPPDLRCILQAGLPVGVGFPNWRSGSEQQLRVMLNLPMGGLYFEIALGRFWWKHWGPRPAATCDALRLARNALGKAPVLVPIYSHCYIPCSPNLTGNPVFFIYKKDAFYCGYDLADFFEREAFVPNDFNPTSYFSVTDKVADVKNERLNGTQESFQKVRIGVSDESDQKHLESPGNRLSTKQLKRPSIGGMVWENILTYFFGNLSHICSPLYEAQSMKSRLKHQLHSSDRYGPLTEKGNAATRGQYIIARYTYFHGRPLPIKILKQFTLSAPPWAAKAARRIDFWSDLVENRGQLKVTPAENILFSTKMDGEFSIPWKKQQEQPTSNDDKGIDRNMLCIYLNNMANTLRKAGWTKDEIEDMVGVDLSGESRITASLQSSKSSTHSQKASQPTISLC